MSTASIIRDYLDEARKVADQEIATGHREWMRTVTLLLKIELLEDEIARLQGEIVRLHSGG